SLVHFLMQIRIDPLHRDLCQINSSIESSPKHWKLEFCWRSWRGATTWGEQVMILELVSPLIPQVMCMSLVPLVPTAGSAADMIEFMALKTRLGIATYSSSSSIRQANISGQPTLVEMRMRPIARLQSMQQAMCSS